MGTTETLYAELKLDLGQLADQLFSPSKVFLQKHGNFLPHGAALIEQGEVRLIAAFPHPQARSGSTEMLPLLYEGLRQQSRQLSLRAIAVAENVTVVQEGKSRTQAIKILLEHRRGLCVALYLPFKKRFLNGYSFGQPFSVAARSEVVAWPHGDA